MLPKMATKLATAILMISSMLVIPSFVITLSSVGALVDAFADAVVVVVVVVIGDSVMSAFVLAVTLLVDDDDDDDDFVVGADDKVVCIVPIEGVFSGDDEDDDDDDVDGDDEGVVMIFRGFVVFSSSDVGTGEAVVVLVVVVVVVVVILGLVVIFLVLFSAVVGEAKMSGYVPVYLSDGPTMSGSLVVKALLRNAMLIAQKIVNSIAIAAILLGYAYYFPILCLRVDSKREEA